tara:strand:- start:68 stop:709 length:642 start_codon:yes stop_codon:yes gene_type:complete
VSKINKVHNIENISDFLGKDEDNCLLINQVNDEIGSFYLYVIIYLSKSLGINIRFNNDSDNISDNNDLFGLKKINIFNLTSSKKLDKLLPSKEKLIIFTDYKNFKKYQKNYHTINGYNFSNDLKTFVKNTLKIESQNLIEICLKNPQLILSETSKYLINKENYLKDQSIHLEVNKILEIRKNIFELKKNKNLKQLFSTIKEEVKYKKFSFLTF